MHTDIGLGCMAGRLTNGMGPREAAENWDLPQEASEEIFAYCEANKALIEAEANEERQRLNRENLEVEARASW